MARTFKRSGCNRYHVEFSDTAGIQRRVLGFTDRNATEELGRMIDRAVAIRQSGGILAGDMLKWLEALRPAVRDNLAKWSVIDPQRAAAGRALADHINEWGDMLEAKGDNLRYVKNAKSHMTRLAEGCKWRTLSDITAVAAQRWLADRRAKGLSINTSNGFVRSIKGFLNWMVMERRISENPLAHIKTLNERIDRRHVRRALTVEEIRQLLAATEAGGTHHGLTGLERALVYRLAIETGLRYSEIRSLTRGAFDFSINPATITIQAANTKNKQEALIHLREELAADLKAHLALSLPMAKAFPKMWKLEGAEMLSVDLKAAGIAGKDDCGRVLDFHALRHTFGTLLAASGVHPRVMQDLMRHSTIVLTMQTYTHPTIESRIGALGKLPDLRAAKNGGNAEAIA